MHWRSGIRRKMKTDGRYIRAKYRLHSPVQNRRSGGGIIPSPLTNINAVACLSLFGFTFLSNVLCLLSRKIGWLCSRVVSVLDSGAEGPGVQIAGVTLSGNSLKQTVHAHCAFVHQAAKLVAALLRVARVTAGLTESNDSLQPGL